MENSVLVKDGIEREFSSDFTAILIGWIDEMNTRLTRAINHLQCRNISPKRSIVSEKAISMMPNYEIIISLIEEALKR